MASYMDSSFHSSVLPLDEMTEGRGFSKSVAKEVMRIHCLIRSPALRPSCSIMPQGPRRIANDGLMVVSRYQSR